MTIAPSFIFDVIPAAKLERGIRLQHWLLGRTVEFDLEEMIHDPERRKATLIGGASEGRERLGPMAASPPGN